MPHPVIVLGSIAGLQKVTRQVAGFRDNTILETEFRDFIQAGIQMSYGAITRRSEPISPNKAASAGTGCPTGAGDGNRTARSAAGSSMLIPLRC